MYRQPPSEALVQAMAQPCFDVALMLDAALRSVCPELCWETVTDTGAVAYVDAPVPPRT